MPNYLQQFRKHIVECEADNLRRSAYEELYCSLLYMKSMGGRMAKEARTIAKFAKMMCEPWQPDISMGDIMAGR